MRTSAFLVQKTSDFLKFMVCPQHGQRGRELIFRDFVRTSFMDGLILQNRDYVMPMQF